MVSVARKNLFAEKTRLFVSVGGVAFSILLIIFLMGVYNAFDVLATAYIDRIGADLVISQEGATDMFHTFSILKKEKIKQVERISGGRAYGLISRVTNVLVTEEDGSKIVKYPGRSKAKNLTGVKETVDVIGFDTKTGVGGPWVMIEGKAIPGKREIIVDQVFSRKTGLGIGDQVEMFDHIFTISGITDKNNMMVFSRAFINLSEAQDILGEKDSVNYILIKLPDPSQASIVAAKLEKGVSGISAFTRSEFAVSNAKMINDSFLPIILVITIISFLTGAVVVGLTVYTATMEKMAEFGVLKAIGATNNTLFLIVFEQALWSSLLGFLLGVLLATTVIKIVVESVPVMVVELNFTIYAVAFMTAILMSLIASYIPVRRIAELDPAVVFRR